MKVIASNLITTVSASSSNANYPDDNLLDKHPKKIWKSSGTTAEITFDIQGGTSNAFALFNTNATGVSYDFRDPNYVVWEAGVDWEDGVEWSVNEVTISETTNLDGVNGSCLAEWSDFTGTVQLIVSLSCATGEVLFAGVAVAGDLNIYPGPSYGFTETGIDYSETSQLSNGSIYIKDRDQVRDFAISATVSMTEFNTFIGSVWKTLGSYPTAWVMTDESDSRWLVYGMFTKPPSGKMLYNDLVSLTFNVTEVI